jgi:hypothetical protein
MNLFQPECFSCADCRKAITSQFYPFNNDYLCGTCHEARFPRKRCGKCGSVITSAGITFAGASYHAACFLCMYKSFKSEVHSKEMCTDCSMRL